MARASCPANTISGQSTRNTSAPTPPMISTVNCGSVGAVKEDAIGDQAREQHPVREEQRSERVDDIGEESQPADAVGMRRDELEVDA